MGALSVQKCASELGFDRKEKEEEDVWEAKSGGVSLPPTEAT